ncbi:MAG: biopolymer transporter ExbD [Candidatus Omnitrophica bacterium]|nr:biopolymer transporter ExbD [Candidatus Omnitrophota bacterium]
MGLEHFKIKSDLLHPVLAIGFINFILMLIILIMSTTIFARPSGVEMKFSSFSQPAGVLGKPLVITVTGENVIYVDGKVVTFNELRRYLAQKDLRGWVLMVKVDGRASMGRVADILDLCRGISGVSVNVSTIL